MLEAAQILDGKLRETHEPKRLEPHGHDNVLGVRRAGSAHQAAAIRIR